MRKFGVMKLLAISTAAIFSFSSLISFVWAQTFAPTPNTSPQIAQIEALTKKIDEQNAKIDILSQEIIKLEQQISHARPGIMIGEGAQPISATATPIASPATESPRPPPNGNSHIVARGETLTSIAKLYNVSVSDLQKSNRIDNPLKLQAGQTLVIPPSSTPTQASPSPKE
jgi:LysM repeat protein